MKILSYKKEDFHRKELSAIKDEIILAAQLTCKERLSITPASQNGTKAMYAKKRPASYLHWNSKEIYNLKKMLKQTSALTQVLTSYMSSAIPKALFSICVNAPAPDALLQSPSVNCPESSSSVYL